MPKSASQALVVANDFPYPPDHGGRVDIWRRLGVLRGLGFAIDLIATVKHAPLRDAAAVVQSCCRSVRLVRRDNRRGLLSLAPLQVASRRGLEHVPLDWAYDLVLLESDHTAAILDNPTLHARLKVLRVHNDESEFCRELCASEPSWLKRLYYRQEAARFARFSPALRNGRVDLIWFSSKNDYERHLATRRPSPSRSRAVFLPPPLDLQRLRTRPLMGQQVLFLGTLALPTNAEGLRWYLRAVHPALCDIPGYRLLIAGNTRGADLGWLPRLAAVASRVSVLENVPDPEPLYESSAVFISPLLRGASIKVKTLHAIENGLPVVSTAVGNEGTGLRDGQHLLIANTAPAFTAAVRALLCDPGRRQALVQSSQAYLRQNYDHAAIIGRSLCAADVDYAPLRGSTTAELN